MFRLATNLQHNVSLTVFNKLFTWSIFYKCYNQDIIHLHSILLIFQSTNSKEWIFYSEPPHVKVLQLTKNFIGNAPRCKVLPQNSSFGANSPNKRQSLPTFVIYPFSRALMREWIYYSCSVPGYAWLPSDQTVTLLAVWIFQQCLFNILWVAMGTILNMAAETVGSGKTAVGGSIGAGLRTLGRVCFITIMRNGR